MNARRFGLLIPVALLALACAAPGATTRPSGLATTRSTTGAASASAPSATATALSATATSPTATAGPPSPTTATATASAAPSVVDAALVCGPIASMPLKNPGRLTLSTDIPSFPPWWGGESPTQYPNEPEGGSEWSTVDFSAEPYSMEGYEGATAYAIAEAMGFTPDLVDWLPNAIFENAFTPGEKPFDFHMAQISITPERAQAVTFSDPYFQANQALIVMSDNPITSATSIADLRGYTIGAGRNTTSFQLIEDVIQPTVEPRVLRSNADARRALENGQIDGLIVDLSTAFFMRDVQIEGDSTVLGQFSSELQADPVGTVLELGSTLTPCVNAAIAEITANGTLQTIYDQWIVTDASVPFFE